MRFPFADAAFKEGGGGGGESLFCFYSVCVPRLKAPPPLPQPWLLLFPSSFFSFGRLLLLRHTHTHKTSSLSLFFFFFFFFLPSLCFSSADTILQSSFLSLFLSLASSSSVAQKCVTVIRAGEREREKVGSNGVGGGLGWAALLLLFLSTPPMYCYGIRGMGRRRNEEGRRVKWHKQ